MDRPFPRTSRPRPKARTRVRALAAVAAFVVAGAPIVVPYAHGDDLRDRQDRVRKQIRGAQGDLHESSQVLAAAARKLARSQAALTAAQRRLASAEEKLAAAEAFDAKMQARLQQAEHELAVARAELAAARAKVKEMRRRIGELAASNYAHGDPALMGLAVMLNSQDPAEATSQLNTVDALMGRQTTELEDLRRARAELSATEAAVQVATQRVAAQRKAAAENLVQMEVLRRDALSAKREVADLVLSNREAEAEAARARRADAVQLQELQRQEQRIKGLILARAARQSGGYSGSTGGYLARPVLGGVTSSYGYRRHPIYGYWGLHDGTDFSAPCGTSLRAAASGTVISRYWSDVYGNRLYVDAGQVNGRNLTLVYNHASSYRVGVGSRVSRGETLGWASNTGWSTGCHLHFTVLLDGSPTDPMNYM